LTWEEGRLVGGWRCEVGDVKVERGGGRGMEMEMRYHDVCWRIELDGAWRCALLFVDIVFLFTAQTR